MPVEGINQLLGHAKLSTTTLFAGFNESMMTSYKREHPQARA
jgi:site-specific recombinase XerD